MNLFRHVRFEFKPLQIRNDELEHPFLIEQKFPLAGDRSFLGGTLSLIKPLPCMFRGEGYAFASRLGEKFRHGTDLCLCLLDLWAIVGRGCSGG